MNSIRAQLNVGILAVLTVVFSAGGWAVDRQIETSLYEAADRNLVTLFRSEVDVLMAQLRPERAGRRDQEGRGPDLGQSGP